MSQAYQSGMSSGAAPDHPAQKPSVTADQGITETANSRPDIASNKDTSHLTDNKGDANVPPNPAEIKAETGHDGAAPAAAAADPDAGEEGDAVKPPPGVEYPEQKHAGKVGLGPAYAETHGAVTVGERFAGLKQEIKGKITRNPETVEKGREMMSGEAKKKRLEQESAPTGTAKPAASGDAKKTPSVAKGAEGDKPIAEAAAAEEKKTDRPGPAKEAEHKSEEAKSNASSQQPQDISHAPSSGAEKAEVASDGAVHPNPPAPHQNSQQSQGTNQPPSSGAEKADVAVTSGGAGTGDVHSNPPASHQGMSS